MSMRPNVYGSRTDVGCVRDHNEDSLIAASPLFAVADGMGGHAAGEVASEIAIELLAQRAPLICEADTLIETVRAINSAIIEAALRGEGHPGMGTTLTAAIVDGTQLLLAQVGDSRAYLLHEGVLQQLTRDHSYVGELLAGGHISADEAATHAKRHVITRALGSDPKTEADLYELEAHVGDRLLLCSDGLYGMVPTAQISAILQHTPDPQQASDLLIQEARAAGGVDNISVIVVDMLTTKTEFLHLGLRAGTEGRSTPGQLRPGRRERARAETGGKGPGRLRRLHLGIITFAVLLAVLIGGAIGGMWLYASNSAFLRTNEGVVVIYRGLPGEILPGLRLEWEDSRTSIAASSLLSSTAERLVEGIRTDSLDDAYRLAASYQQQVLEQAGSTARGGSEATEPNSSSTASGLGGSAAPEAGGTQQSAGTNAGAGAGTTTDTGAQP